MSTTTLKQLKTSLLKKVDFSAILVVYKSAEGYWKGFAHPYVVTCEGNSKDETLTILKGMVKVQVEELQKYGFPIHLSNQNFFDDEDANIFNVVIRDAIDKKTIIDSPTYHAETYKI